MSTAAFWSFKDNGRMYAIGNFYRDWDSDWNIIVSGNFGGGNQTDLLL
jgi:hypothetical protein